MSSQNANMDAANLDRGVMDCFPWLAVVPVIHGSGSYAVALRKFLLDTPFDALAVPLPPSFASAVREGVDRLPIVSAVVQMSVDDHERTQGTIVPIDPCQGVIAALRLAWSEHKAVEWIDPESATFPDASLLLPDPFAVEQTSLERFCCALLPAIPPLASQEALARVEFLADRLLGLRGRYRKVIALCHLSDWPWLRQALRARTIPTSANATISSQGKLSPRDHQDPLEDPVNYAVDSRTQVFLQGEIPFITALYERARAQLEDDARLGVEGLKELFLAARASYRADLGRRARQITPMLISQCLKYIRNQTLMDRRMTPSLYTIVRSAQQMMGDMFAIHIVNAAKEYAFDDYLPWPTMKMGIDEGDFPNEGVIPLQSRLPASPWEWKNLELNRPAVKQDKRKWASRWNPYQQCSWPEEDTRIESFRNRIVERARGMIGADLARSEKFSTSLMDGLDLRETLRHWYDGSLYVKVQPPSIGHLDATIMLFDHEPDPREYAWRATWFAEHMEESTLAFFATPFGKEILGPGVAVSTYGGAMFLYPPRPIDDIWTDPRLDFADTLEQRLVAAACMYAQSKHIALLSHAAPGIALRQIAKRFRRKLVHVPLHHFADSVVQQLRTFHVLNGKHVRSYAAHFIRKV
ncbi:MAG: hypothetical protein MUF23_05350 [Pirellula sp.]|nr:hypothetical protein [Pirellula sp.]